MIKILGPKVVIMILLLAIFNALAGYAVYTYLMPLRIQKEAELEALKAETAARYAEVAKLKEEFVSLQNQLREFKSLEAQGYFSNQNRVDAQSSFNTLRELAGLLNTRYSISVGERIEDPAAIAANHVVLKSAVKLQIESLDDVDVYTFVKALEEKFPGSVDITKFELHRDQNITAPLLRQIGSGQPVKLVSSEVEFDWRTMADKDRLDEFDTSTSSGEQNSKPTQTGENGQPAVAPQGVPAGTPAPGAVPPTQPVPQAVQ